MTHSFSEFLVKCKRYLKAALAGKHWLLIWDQELTEGRIKVETPQLPVYICVLCSVLFSSQSLCSHLGTQEGLDHLPGVHDFYCNKASPDQS
jgi:hypothetical protein